MKGAIAHTVVYVLVNAFLVAIWALTTGDSETITRIGDDPSTVDASFWPIWPILGWGLALAIHLAFAVMAAPRKVAHKVRQARGERHHVSDRRAEQLARRADRRDHRSARRSGRGTTDVSLDQPALPPHLPIPDAARRAMSEADRLVADLLHGPRATNSPDATPRPASSSASYPQPAESTPPATPAPPPTGDRTDGTVQSSAPRPAIATVLFTDMVGSTTLNETLGDAAYASMLQDHRRLVREVIDEYDGREVGTQGDGFLVRFDTPTTGVRAACAIAHAVADARKRGVFEPRLRMGLHCGEAMEDGEDLVGTVVNLAARVCGTAAPDEILITEPVADRLVGRVHLIDRGLVSLRGLSQQRHLLQVDWNDSAADVDPPPSDHDPADHRPGPT